MKYRKTFVLECEEDFDLYKTLDNEPFAFFFGDRAIRTVYIFGRDVVLEIYQKESGKLSCSVSCESPLNLRMLKFLEKRLEFCLGCKENMASFYAVVECDEVLSKFYERIYGTRALAFFDSFEALLSIVCSQNVSFQAYKRMIRNIMDAYGLEQRLPTWYEILNSPEKLRDAGVGYRYDYILAIADFFSKRDRFHIPDETELRRIKGVGNYTSTLFYLLQTRDYSRFYVDILMRKIFHQHYRLVFEKDAELERYARKRFGRYCGLVGLYLQQFLRDE